MKYYLLANICFMLAVLSVMFWILHILMELKYNHKREINQDEKRQVTEILFETSSLKEEAQGIE